MSNNWGGKSVVIVGAGINGLVAAYYLQNAGFSVTVIERKNRVGGAASVAKVRLDGKTYTYPNGASVLGLMQDFVFKETGLRRRLRTYAPKTGEILYFNDHAYQDADDKWTGKLPLQFLKDLERVKRFLIRGYRSATVPTIESARKALGSRLARMWIEGTAYGLLQHYKLSEEQMIHQAMSVNESGPVSVHEPFSAFTVPLMLSGSVFGGRWGFVKGGIWRVTDTLESMDKHNGVKFIKGARVIGMNGHTVVYERGTRKNLSADIVIFATDPLTAAGITAEKRLILKIKKKRMTGTSGKTVLFFKKFVRWKDGKDPAAFRFVVPIDTLNEMDAAILSKSNFSPVFFEIYGEGAAMRRLNTGLSYDYLPIFFKSIRDYKIGGGQKQVQKKIESLILNHIANKGDFIGSVMFTPRDLEETFFFPKGNIDHVEVCKGQTFFQRNYSTDPLGQFHQFGSRSYVFYCGAGAYPCGSIAGTPRYMCAKQIINKNSI